MQQELLSAQSALKGAQADYKSLQATLESTLMDKKIAAAQVNASYTQDQLQAQTDEALYKLGVVSGLVSSASKNTADQLTAQQKLVRGAAGCERRRRSRSSWLPRRPRSTRPRRSSISMRSSRTRCTCGPESPACWRSLPIPLQVGQHVTAGTSVAKVIQLDKLKAALQIAETQARDIQIGQPASIDTHNGIIPGHVSRIDPSVLNGTVTVDVALDGPLPPGARPDLSVDGTIDLATLNDVLYVGRPALGNENSTLSLFKIDPDGKGAVRVPVKVGRASVNAIQVLEGLKEGDTVILSDMSREDSVDRIRLESGTVDQ